MIVLTSRLVKQTIQGVSACGYAARGAEPRASVSEETAWGWGPTPTE